MVIEYSGIIIFSVLALVIALVISSISMIFISRFSSGEEEKLEIYECGFESFEVSRMKFDVRFYLMSILFIVFDLEVIYLFAWCVICNSLVEGGVLSLLFFLFILLVGFIYEWKKGALEWE
jgi:NADH-quinone oxidoreductase subunit A